MIVASAIKTRRGEVIKGHRHHHAFQALFLVAGISAHIDCKQGFVDERGRFLTRQEAAKVARRSGQIPRKRRTLYSEDVWPHDCPEWGTRPPLWATWPGRGGTISARDC